MQRVFACLIATLVATLVISLPAWSAYKVVGPDGKVTYTDRPPADRPVQSLKSNGQAASTEALPYELRQVVSRFPVTLYTAKGCVSCDAARQLLKSRGVPFTEKTVDTNEDIRLFKEREGSEQLPTVRIGKQQIVGLRQADWNSYLDAAGYPARSALPLNHQDPAPTPLAPTKPAATPPPPSVPAAPPADSPARGNAPPGFRF